MQKITREIKLLEPCRIYVNGNYTENYFDPIISFTQEGNIYNTHICYQDDLYYIIREFDDGTRTVLWIYPVELMLLAELQSLFGNIKTAVNNINTQLKFDKLANNSMQALNPLPSNLGKL